MKKIRLLLALFAASIGSFQGAWARTAPTFPEAQTLESGKTYYLYNVGSDRFVYRSDSYVRADATTRTGIVITDKEDGTYTMQFSDNNYYIWTSSSDMKTQSGVDADVYFRIAEVENGYTIQRNRNYDETNFVANNSSYYVYANQTNGNIIWQLFDAEGAEAVLHYRAKKALYDALEAANDYSIFTDSYEEIYDNETSTTAELNSAANSLNHVMRITREATPNWTEYPVFIEGSWNTSSKISKCIYGAANNGNTTTCKATVVVDEDATLIYQYYLNTYYELEGNYYQNGNYYNARAAGKLNVYLDGEEVQEILYREGWDKVQHFFVELTPGKHVIEWKGTSGRSDDFYTNFSLRNIGVQKTPTITVNLTQAGSLGTEVLYNVDHIKDVRKLVIKGQMNDEDWQRVNMMTGLFELDLTDANIENIPRVNPGSYFHKVKLPKTLKSIGAGFYNTNLDEITFPETLTSIGESAFNLTRIKEAIIPNSVTSIGIHTFANNQSLLKVQYSTGMTTIPTSCFQDCQALYDITIPEGITTIGNSAFARAYKVNTSIPSSVKSIGKEAFREVVDLAAVNISDNVTVGESAFYGCTKLKAVSTGKDCTIGYRAFYNCTALEKVTIDEGCSFSISSSYYDTFGNCSSLKEIVFPTTFHKINYQDMLYNCSGLGNGGVVTFKCPTMVDGTYYKEFFKNRGNNITIRVPQYLVNTYKLDSYWYNYNIEGFSTADITDWAIRNNLVFYSQDRFEGTPNVEIWAAGSWVINGDAPQELATFYTNSWSQQYNGGLGDNSKVLSTCDNVTINGWYTHKYAAYNNTNSSPYKGRWHFLCLPFDFKISEITTDNNARFAIRYYDGANRAANGTGGNWKDFDSDAIITAGTGFIIQTNKDITQLYFHSLDNESKQNVVSNKIFVKALDANDSEAKSNKGWNLVGNPWLCYYNIHKLNFTAPITVYDGYNKTYKAYSVIDDDYAILPGQAFFVQCPDEVSEISFPVDGRQMTSVIESQNGARAEKASERKLIDVELCSSSNIEGTEDDGVQSDKTRFVLNPEASMDYQTSRDASKFLEAGTGVPQIYTIEQGEMLAINERPIGDGTVVLGIIIPQDGTYTISAPRCQFQNIVLVDNETGMETDLATDSYTFTASAGTHEARFMLRVGGVVVTSISEEVKVNSEEFATAPCFNLNGQRIAEPRKGLYIMNGKKVMK